MSIFREYDIRGVVGETLFPETAYKLGQAFIEKGEVCVGYDGRLSSKEIEEALIEGLTSVGINVVKIGLCPTPMLYYTAHKLNTDGAIMITGSHNPPNHNGFKMMRGKKSVYGEQIKELGRRITEGDLYPTKKEMTIDMSLEEVESPETQGQEIDYNIFDDYLEELLNAYNGKKPLKIAWDCGNGSSGEVVEAVCSKLEGEHIKLYTDIDGTFPNHHPDPTVAENLVSLIDTVKKEKCDIGIAFDGDGDRVGAVDSNGRIIWGDQILPILAKEVIAENPNTTVIADVKASKALFDSIKEMGGKPLMWKTGHSLIKSKMAETGALLAGEMSGHIFFADKYYGFDDGIYAAIRLINVISNSDESLAEMVDKLPKTYSSPEMRIECPDDRKFKAVEEIKEAVAGEGKAFCDIDGIRCDEPQGWWLVRASNTQPALVARCEGFSDSDLEYLKVKLAKRLEKVGIINQLK